MHAVQNYFHFDWEEDFPQEAIYNINAILPLPIAVKSIKKVKNDAHCRFHAVEREYKYFIYDTKNPFLEDRAWHLPYTLNKETLNKANNNVFFSITIKHKGPILHQPFNFFKLKLLYY